MPSAPRQAGVDAILPLCAADLDLVVDPSWEMSWTERMSFLGMVMAARPRWAVEVGTAGGGSLAVLARCASQVISIDIDRNCSTRLRDLLPEVDFRVGRSQRLLGPALDDAMAGGGRGVVLIDGDHHPAGVSADVNIVIAKQPVDDVVLVMHDTDLPATRAALDAVDWAGSPWVQRVMLDLVKCETPGFGGIGVAFLSPQPRVGDELAPRSGREGGEAVVMTGSPDWRPDLSLSVRARILARKIDQRLFR